MKKRILCYMEKTVSKKGLFNGNSGNFLFNLALETYLFGAGANVDFFPHTDLCVHSSDFVNKNYDMVLYSAANIINPKPSVKNFLQEAKETISKYNVPIFFIGAGLQTDINDCELKFVNSIKSELCGFFEAVAKCGGAFSLRGYKTAEVFKRLGFDNYFVTGCPSMFLAGVGYSVNPVPLAREELKLVINGTKCLKDNQIASIFKKYPESVFMCQDRFLKVLENKNMNPIKYSTLSLAAKFGSIVPKLLKENRIKLFKDIPLWLDYLTQNGFNFSFGSRIHGNVASLLCGIPALIYAQDMRVLEMAEFFDIPYITKIGKRFDIYEQYNLLDYSKFNLTYDVKMKNFQNFFDKYDIPCSVYADVHELMDKYFYNS